MKPQTNTIDFELLKMIQLLVFCSYLAVIWGAAVPQTIGDQELIVGGVNTSISEVPYQVAILSATDKLLCGGIILTPTYILTAAHCLKPKLLESSKGGLMIRAGSSLYAEGGQLIPVKRAVYIPTYNNITYDNDVGFLELSAPLQYNKNVQPIKISPSEPPAGETLKISGWGYTLLFPNPDVPSKWLQSVEVPMVSKKQCIKDFENVWTITPRMLCAGGNGKSSCHGDSGGPIVYKGQLVGIVSFGLSCGIGPIPSVFTNTADPDIKAFINENIPMIE